MTLLKQLPVRVDHVGSLLRPRTVTDARKKFYCAQSVISPEQLAIVEDAAIVDVIRMQEDLGLPVVTDGEFRRYFWHYDFMGMLTGFEMETRGEGIQFEGQKLPPLYPTISGRLDFPDDHPMIEHFKFVAANTTHIPKISIPGPSCCHFRTAPQDIRPEEYKDLTVLFSDLAATYKKAIAAFYQAGCRYLQMDDIFFAYLCDPKHRADKASVGQDPDELIDS